MSFSQACQNEGDMKAQVTNVYMKEWCHFKRLIKPLTPRLMSERGLSDAPQRTNQKAKV